MFFAANANFNSVPIFRFIAPKIPRGEKAPTECFRTPVDPGVFNDS